MIYSVNNCTKIRNFGSVLNFRTIFFTIFSKKFSIIAKSIIARFFFISKNQEQTRQLTLWYMGKSENFTLNIFFPKHQIFLEKLLVFRWSMGWGKFEENPQKHEARSKYLKSTIIWQFNSFSGILWHASVAHWSPSRLYHHQFQCINHLSTTSSCATSNSWQIHSWNRRNKSRRLLINWIWIWSHHCHHSLEERT